jgi:predicted RNA-binding Zn-ribbon protein involved in translation (DUF1610 family)
MSESKEKVSDVNVEVQVPPPPPPQRPPPAYTPTAPAPAYSPIARATPAPPSLYGMISSCRMQCPYCGAQIMTRCQWTFSQMDFIVLIVFFLLFFPLILIPLFCSPWHDYEHYCPQCNRYLGKSNGH